MPERGENNYRDYSPKDLMRLQAIVTLRQLEFSTGEIHKILERADDRKENIDAMYFQLKAVEMKMEHLAEIDSISYDTLSLVANYIIDGSFYSTETEFSESGEKVFQSAQDAWMNLNDISFIHSVDEFYKSRAVFRNALQTHYSWRKPVSKTENDEMLTNTDILDSWKNYNT